MSVSYTVIRTPALCRDGKNVDLPGYLLLSFLGRTMETSLVLQVDHNINQSINQYF